MIGGFLIEAQDAYNEITSSASLQQASFICSAIAGARSKERFGIEAPDDLHLILALAHHQFNLRRLPRNDTEENNPGKHTTAGKARACHQHIASGIQCRAVFQKAGPCSAASHIRIALIIRE